MPLVKSGTPDLSVVVIHHHHRGIIEQSLKSLVTLPDSATFELVVVDNTPEDNLSEWLAANIPCARVISNAKNKGYAANANMGLHAANGRYFMALNPDITGAPGLLDTMVRFMNDHPDVGLAAPRLLNPDGTLQPSCRAFPNPVTLAIRFLRLDRFLTNGSLIHRYLMNKWDHAQAAEVDWVTGAAMIFRREALAEVGGMDESYFMYWEDLDLCLRLWHTGWKIFYVPEASATHEHGRLGVRAPFSRFARWQVAGALRIFRRFGVVLKRQARG